MRWIQPTIHWRKWQQVTQRLTLPEAWLQHDLVRPLLNHSLLAIGFFCLVGTLVLVALLLCPKTYESEAKLFVRVGRENAALDPTAATGQIMSVHATRKVEINSIVDHLGSRILVEKTLGQLDPGVSQLSTTAREVRLRKLQESISIDSPRDSAIVKVKCKAESPQAAQEIAATLVDVYLDEHMRINRPSGSYEFFAQQAHLLKTQLDQARCQLREAKNEFGISSFEDRRTAMEQQASDLEMRIRQVRADLSASQAKTATLGHQLALLPQPLVSQLVGGTPNDGVAKMREELFGLRAREKELLAKYTHDHPLANEIRSQVHDVELALQDELPPQNVTVAAVLAMEVAHRDSLIALQHSLESQRSELRQQLEALNRDEIRLTEVTQRVQQLERQHALYLESSEQARIDHALQEERISNVSVLQPASLVAMPVSPKKRIVLAIGLFCGIAGGIALAFLADYAKRANHAPSSALEMQPLS
jgi:uncharacterized protein involved in exopolysaccharide biosynthesis